MSETKLVLGSSSRYRRELLGRLGIPFTCDSPEIDETPQPGETPAHLSQRLARTKARAVAGAHILAHFQVVGKRQHTPGGHNAAIADHNSAVM